MSNSMWAWRVIVPGLALAACLLVFYDSTRAKPPAIRSPSETPATPRPSTEIRVIAEGLLAPRPGAEVTVGTEAGGVVFALTAREKGQVRKGDLLVEFVSGDQKAALAEAEARLAEVDAEVAFGSSEYQRRVKAKMDGPQFVVELEAARRDLKVAEARRKGAVAAVDRGRLALARCRVASPIDGVVLATFAEVGEVAAPGSRLVTVCDLSRVWVEAEVDEFDASRIAPQDPVTITAEGYSRSWKATVVEVPDRVAGRSVRPEDPGRPSDTRVLLVKVGPSEALPLKLGQRVEVEIRPTKGAP